MADEAEARPNPYRLTGWLGTLADPVPVLAAMCEVGAAADRHMAEYWKLAPRHGEVNLGCGHFDAFYKAEVLAEYLRGLRLGDTPTGAAQRAAAHGVAVVGKWNANPIGAVGVNGRYELLRWSPTARDEYPGRVQWALALVCRAASNG